jgi:hypothetical protein
MLFQRAQPVMPAQSSAPAEVEGAEGQFQFVVNHKKLFRFQVEEVQGLSGGFSDFVHKAAGFQKADLPSVEAQGRLAAAEFLTPVQAVTAFQGFQDQPSRIVARPAVLLPGITGEYDQFYISF